VPYCAESAITTPNGCLDYSLTKEDCPGIWIEPAMNESSCLSPQGCWDWRRLDTIALLQAWSPKDYNSCISEYNQGSWESFYDWTPAVWFVGQQRPLKWLQREVNTKNQWNTTIDFSLVQQMYQNSGSAQIAFQIKVCL
jgi:hypothetical protein